MRGKRIIDSDPAPYPLTNTAEIKAVITFVNILEKDRVKPDIKFLDKIPNTDGIIEIVNTSQIPIGKIDVQIKFLAKKFHKKPKYQCKKDFLASCEQSILPVLLIVVDIENEIAYWQHMDKQTISSLADKIKKNTINLNFEKENFINKDSTNYIIQWINIIENYQEKIFDYDSIKKRKDELDFELNELKNITNTAIGKTNPIFKEIHVFLDFYNGLLDGDFNTVKNRLYPNYWKIGLGINMYLSKSIHFTLYPISYEFNDVLIKQYNTKDWSYLNNVLRYISHYTENPIKSRPQQYSYELIESDTKQILKEQPLFVKDQFIANEYILAFIDKFHTVLGLDLNVKEYKIADIELSLNIFLPLWIEQIVSNDKYSDKSEPILFVIDHIFFLIYPEDIKRISEKVKEETDKSERPSLNLKITSTSFNIDILFNLIAYLRQIGTNSIKREYDTKHEVDKTSYYIWEAWGEEKTIKNVKVFYNHFIRIYDLLVQTYFPNLKNDLKFYDSFNLLIVILDFSKIGNSYAPSIEHYYLKSNTSVNNKTIVYNATENKLQLNRSSHRKYVDNDIVIEGCSYKLVSCSFSVLDFIYETTPILNSINELLKKRLNTYFDKKKKY